MTNKDLKTFHKANIICVFTALTIFGLSFMMGKINFFLILNTNLGVVGDFFFKLYTYFGDGLALIPFGIYILVFKRKYFLFTLVAILLSTILAHYIKGHLIPINPRPKEAIANWVLVHVIPNVEVHNAGSFPSGHTTQAFVVFFILCIVLNNSKTLWLGFFAALLVGYSRVYQAQHFPIDVAGGIVVALMSVWVSLPLAPKGEDKTNIY